MYEYTFYRIDFPLPNRKHLVYPIPENICFSCNEHSCLLRLHICLSWKYLKHDQHWHNIINFPSQITYLRCKLVDPCLLEAYIQQWIVQNKLYEKKWVVLCKEKWSRSSSVLMLRRKEWQHIFLPGWTWVFFDEPDQRLVAWNCNLHNLHLKLLTVCDFVLLYSICFFNIQQCIMHNDPTTSQFPIGWQSSLPFHHTWASYIL